MTRVARLVARGQARAESLMTDTCTIKPVDDVVTNPADHPTDPGEAVTTYGPATYIGKCKIQNQRLKYPTEPVAGEHQWTVAPTEVHVPIAGTDAITAGQVVVIDTSVDTQNEGRMFRVRSSDRKTHGTAIRLLVEEVTS